MKPYRILVVEDEAIVSMDIRERLSRMGYELAGTAATGQRAVDLAAAQQPDLILMDIRLQGEMDGIGAAEMIHQQSRIPVIFLTAYSEDATLERAKLAEPFGYLLKPFDDRELKSSIEIALYKHAAEEEIHRLNRLYDVLSQVNQLIVRVTSREELLPGICRLVVQRGQIDLAWIGWLDAATGRIRPIASCGLTSESLAGFPLENTSHPTGHGDPGSAIRDGQAFIANECGPACCLSPASPPAGPLPFWSCASFPLRFQGRVCGALSLCTVAPGFFRQREIELLHEVAGDISFALDKIEGDNQRRKAELALAESQARLELALEAAQMGVFEWDVATDALYWSPRCLEIYGASEGTRGIESFRALLHPEDAGWVMQVLHHCLEDRTVLDIEFRIIRPDGTIHRIASLARTTYDIHGRPQRMVGTVQDTTARWQAAEQLSKSEARLRLATEAAQMGVWERDLKTNRLYWSAVQEQLMGYEPGTFPGTDEDFRALIHPYSATAHAEARQRVRGETGVFHEELRFRLKDGRERWGLVTGQMLRDGHGEPDRIVGVQFDITERKRMEAQTAALERLGFLLGAAHDPVEAAHAIVDTAREIWNWDACFVLSHDAVQNRITHLINYDTIDGRRERVPRSNPEATPTPMVRTVLQFGAQLILRGEGDAPTPDTSRFGDTARMSQSLMYAPIRHRDGGIGVISVQSYRRKAFTNQDLQTLQALADHCGGTLARLQAEAGLHHSEERFRTVVEQAPDAIVIQIDRRFAYANPAAMRLFGASSLSDLLRQPVLDRIAPPLRAAVSERIRQLNENLPQVAPMEMACVRLDGSTVEVEATSVPFTYENEPGALIFLRDITERRQAENASIEQRNLGLALSATDDLREAVQLCLDAAMRISGMDAGGIYLINEQTGELDLVVHHGLSPDFVRTVAHYAADDPHTTRVREGNAIHLRYADLDLPKRETESNEGLRAITVLPIKHEARVIAVLNVASHQIDVLPPVTRHTLESVATQIGAVIARLRVEESLRKSERQLRALSGRLESMREEERTRISREIHDELGQMLTGIRMDLGSIEHELGAFEGDPRVSSMVERLVAATELTEMTIRTVQRIAAELRPGILDKLGLDMALQYEVDQFRKRTGLTCRLSLPENPQTMNANVATAFFRICQEALTNVARHARATAVEVALRTDGEWLELTVRDNGHGMADADRADFKSLGLLGMQERARQIGGSVTFTSPPDGGTLVALRVPNVPSPAEQP